MHITSLNQCDVNEISLRYSISLTKISQKIQLPIKDVIFIANLQDNR